MELRCVYPYEAPDRGIEDVETFEIVKKPSEDYIKRVNDYNKNIEKELDSEFTDSQKSRGKKLLDEYNKKKGIKNIGSDYTQPEKRKDQYEKILSKIPMVRENFMYLDNKVKLLFYDNNLCPRNRRTYIYNLITNTQSESRRIKTNTCNNKFILNIHIEHIKDTLTQEPRHDNLIPKEIKDEDLFSIDIDPVECFCVENEKYCEMIGEVKPLCCLYCQNKQQEICKKIHPDVLPTAKSKQIEYITHEREHKPLTQKEYLEKRKRIYKSLKKVMWLLPMTYDY